MVQKLPMTSLINVPRSLVPTMASAVWGDLAGPLAGIIHFSVVLEHVLTPLREKGQNVWCPTKKTMPLNP